MQHYGDLWKCLIDRNYVNCMVKWDRSDCEGYTDSENLISIKELPYNEFEVYFHRLDKILLFSHSVDDIIVSLYRSTTPLTVAVDTEVVDRHFCNMCILEEPMELGMITDTEKVFK